MRRKQTSSKLSARPVFWVLAFVVVILAAGTAWWASRPGAQPIISIGTKATPTPAPGESTPEPSPGTPGNAGDSAKDEAAAAPTVAPTPTNPTQGATLTFSGVSYTPQAGGGLRVSNVVSGASTGTCSLDLTDPSGAKRTVSGEIIWSGTYAFCSFGTIPNVSALGTWQADLSAQNGSAKSAVKHDTFEVKS